LNNVSKIETVGVVVEHPLAIGRPGFETLKEWYTDQAGRLARVLGHGA